MRKHTYSNPVDTAANAQLATDAPGANGGLPNRLMTAFEVAEFLGGQLKSGNLLTPQTRQLADRGRDR